MPLSDELVDLADQIAGETWRQKTPDKWTIEDSARHAAASEDEQRAYLEWVLDQPIELEVPDPDTAFIQEMDEGGHGTE